MKNNDLPAIASRHPEAYAIIIAPYAKGKYVIRPLDSRDGWKGTASHACDELNLKYVHRSRGYTASPGQAKRFEDIYEWRIAEILRRAS